MLPPLRKGDRVLIQNQAGAGKIAKRWDRSGTVLEVGDFDQYQVKVDGSGRISLRNRRFLRKVVPYQQRQPAPSSQKEVEMMEDRGAVQMEEKERDEVQVEPGNMEKVVDISHEPVHNDQAIERIEEAEGALKNLAPWNARGKKEDPNVGSRLRSGK